MEHQEQQNNILAAKTMDPATLPSYYDDVGSSAKWNARWEEDKTYHYDPSRPREETFSTYTSYTLTRSGADIVTPFCSPLRC